MTGRSVAEEMFVQALEIRRRQPSEERHPDGAQPFDQETISENNALRLNGRGRTRPRLRQGVTPDKASDANL